MKKITLGKSGLSVTNLCFGALPIGPIQKNVPIEEASDTIAYALNQGINFIDTAKIYKTYSYVREGVRKAGATPVISTKSPATEYAQMENDIQEALREMDVPVIDIFFLHAARATKDVFTEREGALRAILDYREKGMIRAAGISTHDVEVVNVSAENPEIDIVFPIINKKGMGILNGGRKDMENAISHCMENDKGMMFMKLLAGGNLVKDYLEAMDYATKLARDKATLVVGMVNQKEVNMNIRYMNGEDLAAEASSIQPSDKQFLIVEGLCKACGACVRGCHSSAVSIVEGIAKIQSEKCLKCGYCVNSCPEFAIRMI